MANNSQDSKKNTQQTDGVKGEVVPLEGHHEGQPGDSPGNDTIRTHAQVSESRQGSGFSFSDILSLRKALYYLISKALHYLVLLIWPTMPERYKRKFPLFIALVVVLFSIAGYFIHRYWILFVDIPDICGIVYNDSDVNDAVPSEGRLKIYELQDSKESIFDSRFWIRDPQVGMGVSESISLTPQEKRRIKLRLDKNTILDRKELYKYYKMEKRFIEFKFFPGQIREYTIPKRIGFNENTLKREEPAFRLPLIGKEVPTVHGIVFNASEENDAIPAEGIFGLYEILSSKKPILEGPFRIEVPASNTAEDLNILIEPWKERRVKVVLEVVMEDQKKELYSIYREGRADLKLTFFPDNDKRKFSLKNIKFNRKTLGGEEPSFAFDLFGKKTQWTSPCNQICFFIPDSDADPNHGQILKQAKWLLEQTSSSNKWFLVTDVPNFNEWSDKFASYENKFKSSSEAEGNKGHQRSLHYEKKWPTIVRVDIRCTQMDSHLKWNFHVTDAQNRIPERDRIWSENYPATLNFENANEILSIVRTIVLNSYPIQGKIEEIDDGVVELDVGSLMGVKDEMTFSVLPDGVVGGHIGTVKISVVRDGEGSTGFLTKTTGPIKEGFRVINE